MYLVSNFILKIIKPLSLSRLNLQLKNIVFYTNGLHNIFYTKKFKGKYNMDLNPNAPNLNISSLNITETQKPKTTNQSEDQAVRPKHVGPSVEKLATDLDASYDRIHADFAIIDRRLDESHARLDEFLARLKEAKNKNNK